MTVDEFVKEYKAADQDGKKDVVTNHITSYYIPYVRKIALAESIVAETQYVANNEEDEDDENVTRDFRLNTPVRYLVTLMQAVAEYTDLEMGTESAKDFDKLQECDALSDIIDAVQRDFTVFESVVQMTADDTYATETGLVSFMKTTGNVVLGAIQEIVDNVNEAITAAEDKGTMDEEKSEKDVGDK